MIELEELEKKINLAIRLIEKMDLKNNELSDENENLLNQVKQQEQKINSMEKEIQSMKELGISQSYEDKEKIIRTKIQQVLAKLENLKKLDSQYQ